MDTRILILCRAIRQLLDGVIKQRQVLHVLGGCGSQRRLAQHAPRHTQAACPAQTHPRACCCNSNNRGVTHLRHLPHGPPQAGQLRALNVLAAHPHAAAL